MLKGFSQRLFFLLIVLPLGFSVYAGDLSIVRHLSPLTSVTLDNALISSNKLGFGATAGDLSITPGGVIHYLKVFFYSDTACTNLLGSASLIDNTVGFSFDSGQTVHLRSDAVYALANNQGIAMDDIQCMSLYVSGQKQSDGGVACQSFTDETCTGSSCTSAQTKSVSWTSNPSECGTVYAYVSTNLNTGGVSKCRLNSSTGALENCASTAGSFVFATPIGVGVNNGYGYIMNIQKPLASAISMCRISSTDGALEDCSDTANPSNLGSPKNIVFDRGYAYLTGIESATSDRVVKCAVDPATGALAVASCTYLLNIPDDAFNDIDVGISINNDYSYITDFGNDKIIKCTVTPATGDFTDCADTATGFSGPSGIAFNNAYAYITNKNNNTVSICAVNPETGALSGCSASTETGFNVPTSIAIHKGSAYVVNQGSHSISQCTIGLNGILQDCDQTASITFPRSIAIY